jgi:hypothetical protein
MGIFSKRKAIEAEAERQASVREQVRKDHEDAIISRVNDWLKQLESHRESDSLELTDELLSTVGAAPMPVAANAQEANHSQFISDYAMARSYATSMVNRKNVPLTLEIRDAQAVGDEETVARLRSLASFWSSVEFYCSRL